MLPGYLVDKFILPVSGTRCCMRTEDLKVRLGGLIITLEPPPFPVSNTAGLEKICGFTGAGQGLGERLNWLEWVHPSIYPSIILGMGQWKERLKWINFYSATGS